MYAKHNIFHVLCVSVQKVYLLLAFLCFLWLLWIYSDASCVISLVNCHLTLKFWIFHSLFQSLFSVYSRLDQLFVLLDEIKQADRLFCPFSKLSSVFLSLFSHIVCALVHFLIFIGKLIKIFGSDINAVIKMVIELKQIVIFFASFWVKVCTQSEKAWWGAKNMTNKQTNNQTHKQKALT